MPQRLTPNQEAWLTELPKRKQSRYALCNIDREGKKSFCCLGVGVDVARTSDPDIAASVSEHMDRMFGVVEYVEGVVSYTAALLPPSVEDWLELKTEKTCHPPYAELTHLNDSDELSFEEIAEHIRQNPERYFLSPDDEKDQ